MRSFQQRLGHQLRSYRGDGGQNRFRDGGGDQPRTGAQRGDGAHRRRARLAPGSANHQHMAETAFIGICAARTIGNRFGPTRPGQPGRGFDCLRGRTDRRHHDGPLLKISRKREHTTPGEQAGNMGQLGRGKSNDGICAVGFRREETSRVRLPAGRQVYRDDRSSGIALQQLAAGNREVAHRGTEASPQNSVDKELRTFKQGPAAVTVRGRPLL